MFCSFIMRGYESKEIQLLNTYDKSIKIYASVSQPFHKYFWILLLIFFKINCFFFNSQNIPVTRLKVCYLNLIQEPTFLFSSAAVVVPNPHERKGTERFFYTAYVIQDTSTLEDLEKIKTL